MKKIRVDIINGGGESVEYTSVKEIVQTFADDQHIKKDITPSSNGGKEIRPPCVEVYLNKFSQGEKISIKKKVSRKTIINIASENSLRSTTSYLVTIVSSNFIEGKYHLIIHQIPNLVQMDTKNWLVCCKTHLERMLTLSYS